jgi:hypothetical protein
MAIMMIRMNDYDQLKGVSTLGDSVMKLWTDRSKIFESSFAICGWYICVFYRVMDDVRDNDTSEHHEAVERVIEGLYDGLGFKSDSDENMCDTFWYDWTDCSKKIGPFSSKRMWNSRPAIEDESYILHER